VSTEAAETQADEPKKKSSGTALRFASAIPLIAVVLWLLFWAPKIGFELFGYLWIAIASNELMAMTNRDHVVARVWGVVGSVAFAVVLIRAGDVPHALHSAVLGLVVGALLFGLVRPSPIEAAGKRIAWLLGGPVYIAGTLGLLALMHREEQGGAWVLLSMFIAFLSDTFAYFSGRAFGKTKLAPKVSPKKTVEGSLGGLVGSVAGALVLSFTLLDGVLPPVHAAILAVVAGAFGQAGDLLESLIKRSCGVKDSGNIMPGHGGLLDRCDALMFTGATTWLYVAWVT